MAWKIDGRYFENCSCDVPCPCTVSLDIGADRERCNAFLVFEIDSGEVEVKEIVSLGKEDGVPARLVGIFHPAGPDLTIARATTSHVSAFGIDFAFEGGSAFANPFAWAG